MTRKGTDSVAFRQAIDSQNVQQIISIIDSLGWLSIQAVGVQANRTLWLVLQHANLETQLRYFPLLKKSVERGESNAIDMAYLEDRIRMRTGRKQLYGTQIVKTESGSSEFYQIEDEEHVNHRRLALGLEPIEEYAKRFGIIYTIPSHKNE